MGLHLVSEQASEQFCNMCGKEFDTFDKEENFGFHYTVGYGSKYDLNKIDLDLCCDCFDKLMDYILPMCKLNPLKEYNLRNCYEKHDPKS